VRLAAIETNGEVFILDFYRTLSLTYSLREFNARKLLLKDRAREPSMPIRATGMRKQGRSGESWEPPS